MNIWAYVVAIVYVIGGVLQYGLCLGYFQRKWPTLAKENYKRDLEVSIVTGWFGPLMLLILMLYIRIHNPTVFGYGFKWK